MNAENKTFSAIFGGYMKFKVEPILASVSYLNT